MQPINPAGYSFKKMVTIFFISTAVSIIMNFSGCSKKDAYSASFAQKLPEFSLQDPSGKTFTDKNFSKNGLVLVVTSPILQNKKAQEDWNKYLSKAKSGSKAKWVYLEDLQPSFFKNKAIEGMKKGYEPGKEPILLIDRDGKIRRKLKVFEKKTVVLVYDGDDKLVYSETGKPSAQVAKTIWEKAK